MSWFFIALIAPFLWSIVNHVDKYLLSKHSTGASVGALMIFSTFAGIIVMVLAPFFSDSLMVSMNEAMILIVAGILAAVGIMLYLYALEREEASVVVPFMQLIPVFGFIFGYLLLGETLTEAQIVASLIIIFGAAVLSLEFIEEGRWRIRKRVAVLMFIVAIIYALYETLFKLVAVEAGFIESTFWEHVGLLIFGVMLYCFKSYRDDFHRIISTKGKRVNILGLNIGSEVLTLTGNVAINYALLIAPIALVLVVSGFQPVFAFAIGVLLTIFFPHISEEKLTLRHLAHKIIAISIIMIGSYMLFY